MYVFICRLTSQRFLLVLCLVHEIILGTLALSDTPIEGTRNASIAIDHVRVSSKAVYAI